MPRQRLSIALIVFLFATIFGALMAFLMGLSDGARAGYSPPDHRVVASSIDLNHADPVWACDFAGGGPGEKAEAPCEKKPARRGRLCTPLRQAMVRAIADEALAGGEAPSRAPDFFAPAPEDDAPELAAHGGDGLGAPTVPGGSALGSYLLLGGPGFLGPDPGDPTGPGDPGDPPFYPPVDPPAEVPLPGALPFMLTGVAAFFLARRRSRPRP